MRPTLISTKTPTQISLDLADRVRTLRLLRAWTRSTLATRAGVTVSSLRRFETTGKASLDLILKVALALDQLADFDQVLQPPKARTLSELEQQQKKPTRKRGRR